MKGRIKKITKTYFDLNGNEFDKKIEYWAEIKYKYFPFWLPTDWCPIGYSTLHSAKKELLSAMGNTTENIEYIEF